MSLQHICHNSDDRLSYYTWFRAMHTRVDLLFVAEKSEEEMNDVADEAFRLIAEIESAANCFDASSELARVNNCPQGEHVEVSLRLYELLQMCKDYFRRTCGLFDVTIESPSHTSSTIDDIKLDENCRVTVCRPDVYLNLSGMLKGYALDVLRDMLLNRGIENAFLNLGNSSIMGMGRKQHCDGWPMCETKDGKPWHFELCDECYTTSGSLAAANHHIVNPLTHVEAERGITASVLTRSGADGEVLSTAYLIADRKQREELLKEFAPRYVCINENPLSTSPKADVSL